MRNVMQIGVSRVLKLNCCKAVVFNIAQYSIKQPEVLLTEYEP